MSVSIRTAFFVSIADSEEHDLSILNGLRHRVIYATLHVVEIEPDDIFAALEGADDPFDDLLDVLREPEPEPEPETETETETTKGAAGCERLDPAAKNNPN